MDIINDFGYMKNMEILESDIKDIVLSETSKYDYNNYTNTDVEKILLKDNFTIKDFEILLSPAAEAYIEKIAKKAQIITRRNFGNNIQLFTPLYISNYCDNKCIYCGFNCTNNIKRLKLNIDEIEIELEAISKTGLEDILILTGESINVANLEYIGQACIIANKYFKTVGIEVYPMNSHDYAYLHKCGVDYVTVFQETYNIDRYNSVHLGGPKRIFPYRFDAQERAILGGMRGVSFGSLLGLDDFRTDAFATGLHAHYIQRKYPHAEISLSCPRLRPIKNLNFISTNQISDLQLLQIICAYRLFLPYASITVSTRENEHFRNGAINIAATKLSAGVCTGIGSHAKSQKEQGDSQFDIDDNRTVDEIYKSLKEKGFQPVMCDHVFV